MTNIYSDDDWKGIIPYVPPGYDDSKYNILFDQHSHTKYSDGSLSFKQNVEWHLAMGYNALAITDHNNMRHLEEIKKIREEYRGKILILSGIEWTTIRIHLNFLGVSEWKTRISLKPKDQKIRDAIDEAHAQGAVVVCDHIPWSIFEEEMKTHPTRENLLDWEVDFIEIINDDCKTKNVYDEESYDFCKKHKDKIGMITGTDMHKPDGLASGGVHGWTAMKSSEFSEEAIMKEVRDKQTEILYSHSQYKDPGIHKHL